MMYSGRLARRPKELGNGRLSFFVLLSFRTPFFLFPFLFCFILVSPEFPFPFFPVLKDSRLFLRCFSVFPCALRPRQHWCCNPRVTVMLSYCLSGRPFSFFLFLFWLYFGKPQISFSFFLILKDSRLFLEIATAKQFKNPKDTFYIP